MSSKRLAIIDGDGALYRACWNVSDEKEAIEKYLDITTDYIKEVWCTESVIYLGGKTNWRYNVFPQYKGQRRAIVMDEKAEREKELRNAIVDFMIQNKMGILTLNAEADDYCRRRAELSRKRNQEYVVISADKDLDMIIGEHLRPSNRDGKLTYYSITEAESDYNYYKQVLMGDMTDYIKSPKGIGTKTAEKILEGVPYDRYKTVVEETYKDKCGSEWLHALMFTGSLVHIQRYKDDMFKWQGKNFFEHGFEGAPKCYKYEDMKDFKHDQ